VTATDVRAVRSRQWELGVPETFEWVVELAPTLGPAARATGLSALEVPLMALEQPPDRSDAGMRVRRLTPDDPQLAASRAVAELAFGGREGAGPGERDEVAARHPAGALEAVRARLAAGSTVTYVAEDASGVVAVGSHQPVGDVTEVVGIATLPAQRRRGLATAVTAALLEDAERGGAEVVFLSAGSDEVARLYSRLGFARVGTAGLAEAGRAGAVSS
jgi:ribosomal protein S18 acetylase RimI-like enzyme